MAYNPKIHKRKSIRLKGYDYSQAGLYFVTICVKDMKCLFGRIENGEMILNDAGRMVEDWYWKLESKFPDIRCDEMVVMPNHFHCIIENVGPVAATVSASVGSTVGADPRVCPEGATNDSGPPVENDSVETIPNEITPKISIPPVSDNLSKSDTPTVLGEHVGSPPGLGEHVGSPLHRVVQWFETMTTNEYIRGVKNLGWKPFNGKLWQRNYYEHIIRDQRAYENISQYIRNNPSKWNEDKFRQ
jgi:putative transposase